MLCCANGAEAVVKQEIAAQGWRPAFSRPGFVTCKHETASEPPQGIFLRTSSTSLGVIKAESPAGQRGREGVATDEASPAAQVRPPVDADVMIDRLFQLLVSLGQNSATASDHDAATAATWTPFHHLHLWPRDRLPIGRFGFEPGMDPLCEAVAERLSKRLKQERDGHNPQARRLTEMLAHHQINQIAEPHQSVLDLVIVEPDQWFVGCHTAGRWPSRWPGGVQPIAPADEPVSRAYFKAAEAIAWSGFDMRPGDVAVEVGSAPGGACGRLLESGLHVLGVDPAQMDPRIADHPNFTHLAARAGDLPRKTFHGAKWLLVDSTVKPDATLSTVENLVQSRQTSFVGLLITLKLGDYQRASQIPRWHERINGWGASSVEFRQLARNRTEVCVAVSMPPTRR